MVAGVLLAAGCFANKEREKKRSTRLGVGSKANEEALSVFCLSKCRKLS